MKSLSSGSDVFGRVFSTLQHRLGETASEMLSCHERSNLGSVRLVTVDQSSIFT